MPELASPDTEHGRDVRPVCDGRELLAQPYPSGGTRSIVSVRGVAGAVMLCHASGAGAMAARIGLALAVLAGPGVPPAAGQAEDARPLMQPLPLSPTGSPSPLTTLSMNTSLMPAAVTRW